MAPISTNKTTTLNNNNDHDVNRTETIMEGDKSNIASNYSDDMIVLFNCNNYGYYAPPEHQKDGIDYDFPYGMYESSGVLEGKQILGTKKNDTTTLYEYQYRLNQYGIFELYRREKKNITTNQQHVTSTNCSSDCSSSSSFLSSSNSTDATTESNNELLGDLIWIFGDIEYEYGDSKIVLQNDANFVIYSYPDLGDQWNRLPKDASNTDSKYLNGRYGDCFMAYLPNENQATIFTGNWTNPYARIWNSTTNSYQINQSPYWPEDYKVLIPAGRTSAIISIICSFLLLYMIVGRWIYQKMKFGSNSQDRILVGTCFLDIAFSLGLAMSTWATPEDFYNVVGAKGNAATCNAQGFMFQLGIAVPMYYCGLSLIFLIFVSHKRGGTQVVRFIETRIEPVIHFVVWGFALSSSITALVMGFFNSNGQYCYIEPYPYDCELDYFVECTRGDSASAFAWILGGAIVCASYIVIAVLMSALYYVVWKQDQNLKTRYGERFGNGNMGRLKEVRTQAFLYVGGFFITWLPSGLRLLLASVGHESPFWLEVLSTLTLPLQGLFNFMVYVRTPFKLVRKDNAETSFFWVLGTAIRDEPKRSLHGYNSRRSGSATMRRGSYWMTSLRRRGSNNNASLMMPNVDTSDKGNMASLRSRFFALMGNGGTTSSDTILPNKTENGAAANATVPSPSEDKSKCLEYAIRETTDQNAEYEESLNDPGNSSNNNKLSEGRNLDGPTMMKSSNLTIVDRQNDEIVFIEMCDYGESDGAASTDAFPSRSHHPVQAKSSTGSLMISADNPNFKTASISTVNDGLRSIHCNSDFR